MQIITALRDTTSESLSKTLIESDCHYFSSGAKTLQMHGASLSIIPGLEKLPAASVAHSIDPQFIRNDPVGWLKNIEEEFRSVHAETIRIYLQENARDLQNLFLVNSYQPITEIGFCMQLPGSKTLSNSDLLVPVISEKLWELKLELSKASSTSPDGHKMQAASYVAMERIKNSHGYMQSYLLLKEGFPAAAVSLARQGSFSRLKNLLVHPEMRNRGVGISVIKSVMATALNEGAHYLGVYALEGDSAERLYRHCGMTEITRQTEWTKSLV